MPIVYFFSFHSLIKIIYNNYDISLKCDKLKLLLMFFEMNIKNSERLSCLEYYMHLLSRKIRKRALATTRSFGPSQKASAYLFFFIFSTIQQIYKHTYMYNLELMILLFCGKNYKLRFLQFITFQDTFSLA